MWMETGSLLALAVSILLPYILGLYVLKMPSVLHFLAQTRYSVANAISGGRIALGIALLGLLYSQVLVPGDMALVGLFGIGAISDALDGMVARTSGRVTQVGKWLDPLADKCFVLPLFIAMSVGGVIPWEACMVLLIADAVGQGIRPWLARHTYETGAKYWGKMKTATAFGVLGIWVCGVLLAPVYWYILAWIVAILGVLSVGEKVFPILLKRLSTPKK